MSQGLKVSKSLARVDAVDPPLSLGDNICTHKTTEGGTGIARAWSCAYGRRHLYTCYSLQHGQLCFGCRHIANTFNDSYEDSVSSGPHLVPLGCIACSGPDPRGRVDSVDPRDCSGSGSKGAPLDRVDAVDPPPSLGSTLSTRPLGSGPLQAMHPNGTR